MYSYMYKYNLLLGIPHLISIKEYNPKKIYLYNDLHLGDCIMVCIMFHNIKNYIEANDIHIYYSVLDEYINVIKEFIPSKNIHVQDKFENKGIRTWVGSSNIKSNYYTLTQRAKALHITYYFDEILMLFYTELFSIALNINLKLKHFLYRNDLDLIYRYNNLPNKYQKIDILINNCFPLSGQYKCNEKIWDDFIIKLNNKYKVVTTKKINNINCTLDDNYSVKTIAAISTHCKVIIAINSGPVIGFLNNYTLDNVKKVYIFDSVFNGFSYKNFETKQNINEITFEELDKYIF
jgi:hypothetical protein